MQIAVDAMGGDLAPGSAVRGALAAVESDPELRIVLVGDEAAIREHLPASPPPAISIHHTTEVISATDEPVRAVRRKGDSSLVKAIELARDQVVDAAISAGNTGALMIAGLLIAGRMEGIERPALATMIPTATGKGTLLLDVGANMDAKPGHLANYAIMGSIYTEKVLGYDRPAVGLLNVGTEAAKGNELSKATFPLLSQLQINFIGNVEARDVLQGVCDVLVCDGFSGNVLLKSMEGAASTIFSLLKQEMTATLLNKIAASILKPRLSNLKRMMDYAEYGGAPLLGLKRPVIKAHGSSDERAMKNAILTAARFAGLGVNETIQQEISAGSIESE